MKVGDLVKYIGRHVVFGTYVELMFEGGLELVNESR